MGKGRQTPHPRQLLFPLSLLDGWPSSVAPAQPGQDQTQCQMAVTFKTASSFMIITAVIIIMSDIYWVLTTHQTLF